MPLKRLLAAVGILPFLLVTFFLDAYTADTGAGDALTPMPIAAAQIGIPLTGSASASLGLLPAPAAQTSSTTLKVAAAAPANINGVSADRIVVLPDTVRQHIREIYAAGQLQGRNPRAFSKVGDSTMVYPPFLAVFDGTFNLGAFGILQRTVNRFAGSFGRESVAARKSMHTWTEFDPTWTTPGPCQAGEGPLACELRLNNPSIAIIRLGANDVSAPQYFDEQLRKIVDTCLARGVIPVVGTKPDRLEGQQNTLNKLIGAIARSYRIPLWDYDLIAATVPGKGLEKDAVHFRGNGSHDYSSRQAFTGADSLEDLTGLMMLDAIYAEVNGIKAH